MDFYQMEDDFNESNMERQIVPYWFWWPFFPPGPWFFPRPPRPPFPPGPRPPFPPGPRPPRPPRPRNDSTYL